MGKAFSCFFPSRKGCKEDIGRSTRKRDELKNQPTRTIQNHNGDVWKLEDMEDEPTNVPSSKPSAIVVDPTTSSESTSTKVTEESSSVDSARHHHINLAKSAECSGESASKPESSAKISKYDATDSGLADANGSSSDVLTSASRPSRLAEKTRNDRRMKETDRIPLSLRQVSEDYSKRIDTQRKMTRALLRIQKSQSSTRIDQREKSPRREKCRVVTENVHAGVTIDYGENEPEIKHVDEETKDSEMKEIEEKHAIEIKGNREEHKPEIRGDTEKNVPGVIADDGENNEPQIKDGGDTNKHVIKRHQPGTKHEYVEGIEPEIKDGGKKNGPAVKEDGGVEIESNMKDVGEKHKSVIKYNGDKNKPEITDDGEKDDPEIKQVGEERNLPVITYYDGENKMTKTKEDDEEKNEPDIRQDVRDIYELMVKKDDGEKNSPEIKDDHTENIKHEIKRKNEEIRENVIKNGDWKKYEPEIIQSGGEINPPKNKDVEEKNETWVKQQQGGDCAWEAEPAFKDEPEVIKDIKLKNDPEIKVGNKKYDAKVKNDGGMKYEPDGHLVDNESSSAWIKAIVVCMLDGIIKGTQRSKDHYVKDGTIDEAVLLAKELNSIDAERDMEERLDSTFSSCALRNIPSLDPLVSNTCMELEAPHIPGKDRFTDDSLRQLRFAFFKESSGQDKGDSDIRAIADFSNEENSPVLIKDDDMYYDNLCRLKRKRAFHDKYLDEDQNDGFKVNDSLISSREVAFFQADKDVRVLMINLNEPECDDSGKIKSINHSECTYNFENYSYDELHGNNCSTKTYDNKDKDDAIISLVNDLVEYKRVSKAKKRQLLLKHKKHELVTVLEDNTEEEKEELECFCQSMIEQCLEGINYADTYSTRYDKGPIITAEDLRLDLSKLSGDDGDTTYIGFEDESDDEFVIELETIVEDIIGEEKEELDDYCRHILHRCLDFINFNVENSGRYDTSLELKPGDDMTESIQKLDATDVIGEHKAEIDEYCTQILCRCLDVISVDEDANTSNLLVDTIKNIDVEDIFGKERAELGDYCKDFLCRCIATKTVEADYN